MQHPLATTHVCKLGTMDRWRSKINKKWTLGKFERTASTSGASLLTVSLQIAEEQGKEKTPTKLPYHSRNNEWANGTEIDEGTAVEVAMETAITLEKDNDYLKGFICKVFNLSYAECASIWSKVQKHIMQPDLKLSCIVVRAEFSPQKEENKHWYCNIGILQSQHLNTPRVESKNLTDWEKEGLVSEVFTIPLQLDPTWEQQVELPIQKPADEYLVLEVWDQNGKDSAGIKGLKRKQKDGTFRGRMFYCLKPVSSDITRKTFELYSHSTKHKRGTVQLLLSINGKDAQKGSLSESLKEHRVLLTKIVIHESQEDARRKGGGESDLLPWDAQMDLAAKSLIKYHAQFRSLSDFHQIVIRFSVLFSYHKANTLEMSVLTSLVDSISKLSLSSYPSDNTEGALLAQLYDKLHELLTMILKILNNHLVDFDVKSSSSIESLKEHLILLKKLYSMEEFVNTLTSNLRSITGVVESAIQKSVVEWYTVYSTSLTVASSSELDESTEEILMALSGVFNHVLNQCSMIKENVAPIFLKLFELDYLAHVFLVLDSHFERAAKLLKNLAFKASNKERLLGMAYQLFVTFQELKNLSQSSKKRFPEEQQLNSYHLWFKGFVSQWINQASTKCKKGIAEAIKNDKTIAEQVVYTSSLVDTMTLFHNMVVFWKRLKWPDPEEAYSCLSALIINITEAALYYAAEIYKKADKCFSTNGQLIDTVQLCTLLNNMQTIRDRLSPPDPQSDGSLPEGEAAAAKTVGIINELGLQDLFDWLEHEKGIGLKLKEFVTRTMKNAADDIENMIELGTSHLGKQFIPQIRVFIEEIIQTNGLTPSIENLQGLEKYLNDNLPVLSEKLLYPTFKLILKALWSASLRTFIEVGDTQLTKASHWQTCRDIVLSLKDYFHAEGDGLSGDDLEGAQFKAFLCDVNLRSQPTSNLLFQCCNNLSLQQMMAVDLPLGQQKLGQLHLTVGYHKPTSIIVVQIQEALDIPTDKNFKPCVEVELLPTILLEDGPSGSYKTSARKQQTQNPQFNETFEIPVHSSLMQVEGTVLTLLTSNSDAYGKNSFIGLCVVPCNIIPHHNDALELEKDPMELKLPLFHIKKSDVLQELVIRHQRSDEVASQLYNTLVKKFKANI